MKILNYGSLGIDEVFSVSHIAGPGETVTSLSEGRFPGGKGLNQSIAITRAGGQVYHGGCVGTDGQFLVDLFHENGVDTTFLRTLDKPTGRALIQVDEKGQNSIVLSPGANRMQQLPEFEKALAAFAPGDLLLLQNEVNDIDQMMRLAKSKGMKVALNPSPFDAYVTACPLEMVDLFLLNEVEGAQLTGVTAPEEIADALQAKFPHAMILLTLGSQGSICVENGSRTFQKAFRVQAVDTTGAGDTYTGYFLAAWAQGCTAQQAMLNATMASAISVTRKGASSSIPYKEEVEEALRQIEK